MIMSFARNQLPWLITALISLIMIINYFFVSNEITILANMLQKWAVVITAFALTLGTFGLGSRHVKRITQRSGTDWIFSVILLASLAITIISGLVFSGGISSSQYQWWYEATYTPLSLTTNGILVFSIVMVSWRMVRIRNIDSVVLVVAAIGVMMANAPMSSAISPFFEQFGSWIKSVPNTAGQRALIIGIALGAIALSVRVILGLERIGATIGD